jgi:uncharacterized protein YgbK (DUF1537 family)
MKHLRLIADDLAGALDTSAQFAGNGRAIRVFLDGRLPEEVQGDVAIDAATRDRDGPFAAERASRMAAHLFPGAAILSYKKVDSWLRGNPGLELAATLRAAPARHCIIAPAFPVHGRVTRGGRQYLLGDGARKPVGEDLRAVLTSLGIEVNLRGPGDAVPEGVSLWDAETDLELGIIAGSGSGLPGVLWCGSGGLAAAIAGSKSRPGRSIRAPMLGVFGSDHPVTEAQLAAFGGRMLMTEDGGSEAPAVAARLREAGVCFVGFRLPAGASRPDAAGRIARGIAGLVPRIPPPKSLLVTGGETALSVCLSVGADHLEVEGALAQGIPVSRIVGGIWDGVQMVSKSGAFGDEMLLLRLVSLLS